MVEEDALAEGRVGVDVGLEHPRGPALQIEREVAPAEAPQRMGETMRLDRVKTLEVEQRLDEARAGGVAVEHRQDVDPERLADSGIVAREFREGLDQQHRRDVAVIEPRRDTVDHRGFQAVVVENRRQHQLRQRRLAAQDLVRLRPHARKQRIGAADLDDFGALALPHDLKTPHPRRVDPVARSHIRVRGRGQGPRT